MLLSTKDGAKIASFGQTPKLIAYQLLLCCGGVCKPFV